MLKTEPREKPQKRAELFSAVLNREDSANPVEEDELEDVDGIEEIDNE